MISWKSFRVKIHKASQLSLIDAFVILEAWILLAVANLALRGVSLERLQSISIQHSSTRRFPPDQLAKITARFIRLAEIAANLHPCLRMTCLCQALALQWMLTRRGIQPVLRLGVLNDSLGVHGHAWLELNGAPLGEDPANLAKFSLLARHQNESW
jgi:Transglutaminase-like superfamily